MYDNSYVAGNICEFFGSPWSSQHPRLASGLSQKAKYRGNQAPNTTGSSHYAPCSLPSNHHFLFPLSIYFLPWRLWLEVRRRTSQIRRTTSFLTIGSPARSAIRTRLQSCWSPVARSAQSHISTSVCSKWPRTMFARTQISRFWVVTSVPSVTCTRNPVFSAPSIGEHLFRHSARHHRSPACSLEGCETHESSIVDVSEP